MAVFSWGWFDDGELWLSGWWFGYPLVNVYKLDELERSTMFNGKTHYRTVDKLVGGLEHALYFSIQL